MRKLLSMFSFVLVFAVVAYGQPAVEIPISVSDGTTTINLSVGLDLAATECIDPALGESELPPDPPAGVFYSKFVLPAACGPLNGVANDYRNAPAFPFTGVVQHNLKVLRAVAGTEFDIIYTLPPEAVLTISDQFGGIIYTSGPLTGSGTLTVGGPALTLTDFFATFDYTNIGPSGPTGPQIGFTPPSLDFGDVVVGESLTLGANVNNTGDEDLIITSVTPTGPFTTTAAPVTIPAGGSVAFDVTFTPTATGVASGTIDFVSNAPSSPDSYSLSGNGTEVITTPTVNVNLVNVGSGSTVEQDVIVTNNGSTPIVVDAVITELPFWDITPATATIPAGGDATYALSFSAPSTPGTYPATLDFFVGATSIITVPLTATVVTVAGLIFDQDTVYQQEEAFYTETMQLLGTTPGEAINSIQFRLKTNQNVDDNTILTFQSIEKGGSIASNDNWVLDYNVFRGAIQPNGASQDVIYVLLYNIAGGALTGDYSALFDVTYRVADLPALTDSVKSSFLITDVEASTLIGTAVDITPSRDELVVIAKNRTGGFGDVNGDGCVDILDLIMVVDHIVGRDSLDAAEFERADIAPWVPGNELPDPDEFVNVQDLSVIQWIILNQEFPSGVPLGPCGPSGLPKFNGVADATVNIYINNEGISAYVDSKVGIRGAQIEFENVIDDPENLVINTPLGQGYYQKEENMFRTLMYDRLAQDYIEDGVNKFMADMPFVVTNPEEVTLERLILVDINQKKVMNVEVNLIYSTISLPYDYVLWQNYPNPFNPTTAVRFQVPKTSDVTVKIYDMLGQEVRTLFAGEVLRGTYTVDWDGMNNAGVQMSSGTYVYRMVAGEFVQSKKMVLLK